MPESKKNKIKELLKRAGRDGLEIRTLREPVKVELREDGTIGAIVGYPIVYNKDSEDMGFIEQIAPGAATKALKRSNVRGLKNHDPSLIFARQGVNLTLTEDKAGVRYVATPIDTRNFREVAEEVRLELLTGQSFGFSIHADEWKDLDTDKPRRRITELDIIYDVGPVTYEAYQDTTVALRSLEKAKEVPPTLKDKLVITIPGLPEIEYIHTGDDRFDRAAETIESLRSEICPTAKVSDNADDGPTAKKSTDKTRAGADETLDKINEVIERLRE